MNETLKRIISGLVIAIVYALSFHFEGYGLMNLLILVLVVAGLAIRELFLMFEKKATLQLMFPALATAFVWVLVVYSMSLANLYHDRIPPKGLVKLVSMFSNISVRDVVLFFPLVAIFSTSYHVFFCSRSKIILNLGLTALSFIYIAIPTSLIILLRSEENGVFYIYFVTWATAMSDVMGFAFGKLFGKHKVNWTISPNKTWEGYIGGFFGQILSVHFFYFVSGLIARIPVISPGKLTFFAGAIYMVSVLGDLSESRLKRAARVKDSGNIIPGHGGVLDRIDSLMFAAPFFYLLLERFPV